MAECEVSMLSEISKFEPNSFLGISCNLNEKQTANEEVNGEENEKSVINTQIEKETVNEEVAEDSAINTQNEKQTVDEEVNGEGDGNSVMNTQHENEEEGSEEEQNGNVDRMDEYPPLPSRAIQVHSANSVVDHGRNNRGWVNLDISIDSPEESVASSEVCSTDELGAEKANGASTKASSCFLIKIPRLEEEVLKEQIRLAELHLDEKTSLRDAIRVQIDSRIQDNDYEHAVDEVKSVRELVKLKRKEIDSHLSTIRVVKNALSFDDMDSQEAFEQQLEAEQHLKALKKELGILKASVLKAETAAAVAQKKNHYEEKKVKELQARFRVANDACQAAYAQLRSLRTQHREKMRTFYEYRDEGTFASKYAYRKSEADRLCKNQVERFMKMWNKNDKFRQDYVKSNANSTVRRFGTLDGRSLGPGEMPHMLPRHVPVVNTVQKGNREKSEAKDDGLASKAKEMKRQEVEADLKEEHWLEENEQVLNKGTSEASTRNGKDVSNEVAEEMERKEAEVELKGQKLELVEANEAGEAEKAEMGEELKAQMEAEKREKKRHKRLRLKEKKKSARDDVRSLGPSEEPPSDVHQRVDGVVSTPAKDVDFLKENSEQSTSLKEEAEDVEVTMQAEEMEMKEGEEKDVEVTMHAEEMERKEGEEKDVEVTMHAEEMERKEGEEKDVEVKEPALELTQTQGQTEADQREKKREKRLRTKERKKAARGGGRSLEMPPPTLPSERDDEMLKKIARDENQQVTNEETPEPAVMPRDDVDERVNEDIDSVSQISSQQVMMNELTPETQITHHENEVHKESLEQSAEAKDQEEVTMQQQAQETELIELVEANEARQALMAQMRAQIKAELEAELRDKNKDKRLRYKERKKERKNAAVTTATDAPNGRRASIWVVIIIFITLILFTLLGL